MNQPAAPKVDPRYRLWSLLAFLAVVTMDSSLAAMWYRALLQAPNVPWIALLAIMLGILIVSQVLAVLTARLNWPLWVRQALFLAWTPTALLGSMKLLLFAGAPITLAEMIMLPIRYINMAEANQFSFVHVIFILALLWRGVSLVRAPATPKSVSVAFQMELIFLLLYGMFFAPRYPGESIAGLYLFLFSGLIALSATRIISLSDLRGGRMPQFNRVWLASTFGSALLVVALAVILGWLSSGNLVEWVIKALAFVFTFLAALLTWLLQPLARLLWRALPDIMEALKNLFGFLSGIHLPKFIEDIIINLEDIYNQIVPAVITGRRLFLVIVVVVIMLAVLFGLRLIRSLRPPEEEQESADTDRTSLRDLLNRFKLGRRSGALGRRYSARQLLAAMRIRQVYSQLLNLSQHLGVVRPAASTPLEFLPHLQGLFAQEPEGVQTITHAYVKIRYGEYPESSREVEEVLAAWDRVRKHGRVLSRHKKAKS